MLGLEDLAGERERDYLDILIILQNEQLALHSSLIFLAILLLLEYYDHHPPTTLFWTHELPEVFPHSVHDLIGSQFFLEGLHPLREPSSAEDVHQRLVQSILVSSPHVIVSMTFLVLILNHLYKNLTFH
jgi:hypothetical protein